MTAADQHRSGCGCATCGPQRLVVETGGFSTADELRAERFERTLIQTRDELMQHCTNIDQTPRRWVWDLRKLIDEALAWRP